VIHTCVERSLLRASGIQAPRLLAGPPPDGQNQAKPTSALLGNPLADLQKQANDPFPGGH